MKKLLLLIFLAPLFGCDNTNIKVEDYAPKPSVEIKVIENRSDSVLKYILLNKNFKMKEDSIEILYLRTGNSKYIKEYDYYDSIKVVYGKLAAKYINP